MAHPEYTKCPAEAAQTLPYDRPFPYDIMMSYQSGTEISGVDAGITYGERSGTFTAMADRAKDQQDLVPNLSLGLQYTVYRKLFHLEMVAREVYDTSYNPRAPFA
jgi:hypothetical protein